MKTSILHGVKSALVLILALTAVGGAQAATRTLSFATPDSPAGTKVQKVWEWWADRVNQQTDGTLKIKFYYMGSLVKLKDTEQAVSTGIADMGFMSPAYTPDALPLWYLENTHNGPSDQYVVAKAFHNVRERYQPLRDEEKRNNLKYIMNVSNGAQVYLSTTRPYFTPSDFKGDKVRMPGSTAKVAQLAGWDVTPVSLYFAQIYSAMSRGTIDGTTTYIPLIASFKQNEVGKYVVEPKLGQNSNVVMMNRHTWDSLTDSQKKVINGLEDELLVRTSHASMLEEAHQREALQNDPKYPLIFKTITEAQREQWTTGMALGDKEMVKKMSRWDKHAGELFELYKAEIGKVAKDVAENGYPWEQH